MPVAKNMDNLDEPVKKFIDNFEASMDRLSQSIKKGNMPEVNQTLTEMRKNTDDLIAQSEALIQEAQDSLSN